MTSSVSTKPHGFIELLSAIAEVGKKNSAEEMPIVLEGICDLCNADGCVLWLWAEGGPLTRKLYPATEWFRDRDTGLLGFLDEESKTAQQAMLGTAACFSGMAGRILTGASSDEEFLRTKCVDSFCVIPIPELDRGADGVITAGALNFYRYDMLAVQDADFEVAQQVTGLVFQLVTDVENHHAFQLLRSVNEVLHRDAPSIERPTRFTDSFDQRLTQLLMLVLSTFRCLEGSIYLLNPTTMETRIQRRAQFWPWKEGARSSYEPGEGLTGYCFGQKKPVRILDLRAVGEGDGVARSQWTEAIDISQPVPGQERSDGMLAPLSFMAVPIVDAGTVIGVLRCSVIRSAPYYFSRQQENLLGLVANQAADWCGGTFRVARANQYVEKLSILNVRARESVDRHHQQTSVLYQQALETVAGAVPEAHSYCLRMKIPAQSRLKFECHYPSLEGKWRGRIAERQKSTILPLSYEPGEASAAADSFNTNDTVVIRSFREPGCTYRNLFFEETDALVVVPVSCGNDRYGTIEVRFRLGEHITAHTISMMELLGQQLGLYIYLKGRVEELDRSKMVLNATMSQQQEALEMMVHQINTPLIKANMKANLLSGKLASGKSIPVSDLVREQLGLTGLIRRSKRVAASMELFVALARREPLPIHAQALNEQTLDTRLSNAVRVLNAMGGRRVEFLIAPSGPEKFPLVYLDLDLLDQMLDNLFDNAEKYGAPDSEATISYGETHKQKYFYISVASRGLPVTPQRAQRLAERGERSAQAIQSGQEGHGLGLYIVKSIMKAHDGRLEILPTDKRGITDFRLLFPTGAKGIDMRYALLDDDLEYSQLLVQTLDNQFPVLSGSAEIVLTEKDFRERFNSEEAFDVDFFILDIMVQWADASEPILPPAETVEGGYFRAGVRCLELIQKWKPAMPVVVHSALNAKQISSAVKAKGLLRDHLWILEKGENDPLFDCIGEVLKGARPGP